MVGHPSHGFFIDIHDNIYFPNHYDKHISVWNNDSLVRNLTTRLSDYTCIFVASDGGVYFENAKEKGTIEKWQLNTSKPEFVTKFNSSCYAIFIDINDTLYCSLHHLAQVVSVSLSNSNDTITVVAGDARGEDQYQLNGSWGIFVDTTFNLYVADANNHRIQLFQPGQRAGITVAGNGIPDNLTLNLPTDVILDADGYLFIADNENHRIIRVGSSSYYCVAGCSRVNGSAPDQFQKPYALRFDSRGNIYVADEYNKRIQKFTLATNTCGTSDQRL